LQKWFLPEEPAESNQETMMPRMIESRAAKTKRWAVLALALSAVALYFVAFSQPMWGFYLYSPQYPAGLRLSIHLNGVLGDTAEINTLNHYIGMARLDEAATVERALSGYGVGAIGLLTMLLVAFPGRRFAKYFAWPAFLFPVAFVGMTYFWMYHFGHSLRPDAPIHVKAFTPVLLGSGQIGNFSTVGLPGAGFYMILLASIAVGAALYLRRSVCMKCPRAAECGAICPHLFLGKVQASVAARVTSRDPSAPRQT
jgi:hypothetical protein